MRQLLFIITIFFLSCIGSETYRGSWKAMDSDGAKIEIIFSAKSFVVKDSTQQSKNFEYSQNSVEINNSKKNYGITLSDGRKYRIYFPKADNDSIGLIKDDNGNVMYSISRNSYITVDNIYKFE